MYETLFWSLLSTNALLAIYLGINAKMHAQPWRLFAIGCVLWIAMFWMQDSTDTLAKLLGEQNIGKLKSGIQLLTTAVGAMVGALFGTAITNRAQFLNKKAIDSIVERMELTEKQYRKPAEEIYARLTDQSRPLTPSEMHSLIDQRKELLIEFRIESEALKRELKQHQA